MRIPATAATGQVEAPRRLLVVASVALGLIVFLALVARFFAGGSSLRAAAVALLTLLPFVAYFAIKRPLFFPLGLYVVSIPLNDILYFPQFGTLSKLIGVLTFAALALWLVRNRTFIRPSATVWAWFALVVWMGMTGMWALERADWWQLLPTLIQLACLYALISLVPVTSSDMNAIWFAIILGGMIAALVGLYDFFFARHVTWLNGYTTEVMSGAFNSSRLWVSTASGDVVDPNHYAGALLLPICVAVAAALGQRSWLLKAGLALCFLTMMFAMYMSGSRDALLALAIAFAYLLWKMPERRQLAAWTAIGALSIIPLYAPLAQRFAIAASTGGAGRLVIWHVGLSALKDYWLLGAGLGNFPNVYFQHYVWVYTPAPMPWPAAGHNLLLTGMVELGVVGLGLLLLAWGIQFVINRQIQRSDSLYVWRITLEASLLAIFFSSMFLDNMIRKYTWLVFAAMALLRSRFITRANHYPEDSEPNRAVRTPGV
jgi:O-Antigen ligase